MLPSYSKELYFLLLRIPMRYLYLFTIFFLLLLPAMWWFFLYQPAVNDVFKMQETINQLHQKTHILKKSERELAAISKSLSEMKVSVQGYASHQPRTIALQQALAFIADSALKNGMMVHACRLCSEQTASNAANQISIDCKGTLEQMIIFFETLKNSKRMIDCFKCDLVRAENDMFTLQTIFNVCYV